MTTYCANDPCEAEATTMIEETETPLCATCAEAFAWGQASPDKSLVYLNAVRCPCCDTLCKDDVTIEDHGLCYNCHQQTLHGERCSICWSTEHATEQCPSLTRPAELYPERARHLENGIRVCATLAQEGDVLVFSSTYNADVAAEVLGHLGYSEDEIEKLIVIDHEEG